MMILNLLKRVLHRKNLHLIFVRKVSLREPCQVIPGKMPKEVKAEEAFECLKSGMVLFVSGAATTPHLLIKNMVDYAKAKNLEGIKIYHMHLQGELPFTDKSCEKIFRSFSFLAARNVQKAIEEGRADAIPVFLSEVPTVFFENVLELDIAILNVSPPDKHGYCTFGTSVGTIRAATKCAKTIIAQINDKMPRTYGDSIIHISQIDYAVRCSEPLPVYVPQQLYPAAIKVAKLIAEKLVDDGSTIQVGNGHIPNAALAAMVDHKDLGIHTEMFSDGIITLIEKGCITNKFKRIHPGKTVTSFIVGTQKLYDLVDNNPNIDFLRVEHVNNSRIISNQPRMVAINSCIEIDITGQVVSDSIGTKILSGFGGQVDFVRGACESFDHKGKAVIALSSLAKGQSKIVPIVKLGAGIVTTRAHVHYVVTEHGITNLFGKSLRQRAYELIRIAHPTARESLERAAFERLKVIPSP